MSNALLTRIANVPKTYSSPLKFQALSIRHKSGKRFLIPDSFQPHLRANNNRRNGRRPEQSVIRSVLSSKSQQSELKPQEEKELLPLDNRVEYDVRDEVREAFALDTTSMIHDFCGQTHHPHITTSMKAKVDVLHHNHTAIEHFWSAVSDYLPRDVLTTGTILLPTGKTRHYSYSWGSSSSGDNQFYGTNLMNLGWHLFLYTNAIKQHRLLYDGTDIDFLPGPASIWRYRLWAGGSINLYGRVGSDLNRDRAQHRVERPVDLRIVGADQVPEKLFVTVSKRFYQLQDTMSPQQYNVPGVLNELGRDPVHDNYGSLVAGPYLEEKYTLCFLRNPPSLSGKGVATKVIPPPRQPKFSHTLTPDRHLLFCWSALSYNAHLIHLDKQFAREEYGAKDLVVHGPLTLVLVLEWFHRQITKYALERQLSRFHLMSIDYKCLAPLYVDEPMTLCTKPSKFPTPGTLAESWEVWVERDLGDGLKSVAFKGTIKLRTENEPKNKGEHRAKMPDRTDDEPEAVVTEPEEFKSPFF